MLRRTAAGGSRQNHGRLVALALLLALLPGLALSRAASAQAGTWAVECVDCPKAFAYMTDRSLRLDAHGHPHVVYGENGLRHAWHDGAAWQYELVDGAPWTGSWAALVLDTAGQPHVSYQDSRNGDLKYAVKSMSGWQIEVVHSIGDVGFYTSLALDADGRPHISHAYSMGSVYYATKDDQGWHLENPASGFSTSDTSLAVDAQGYPHIAFHNDDSDDLEYIYKDAYGWHRSVLIGAADTSTSLSLALDAAGEKHISYYDENGSALKYYTMGVATVVDSQPGTIWGSSSIALNAAGRPRITYRDEINGGLRFAYNDGSGWQLEIVDAGVHAGFFASLALDVSGQAHVSYMDGGALKYAVQSEQEWTIGVVDQGARTGGASSLALWHLEVVDAEGTTPAMALDASGRPHITYGIKYTHRDAGGWHGGTLPDEVGGARSLALDQAGNPHVTLGDTYALRYATRGHALYLPLMVSHQ